MGSDMDGKRMEKVAEHLHECLRAIMHDPVSMKLDSELLPESFQKLGQCMRCLAKSVVETKELANALAKGRLDDVTMPSCDNGMAGPLKALHSTLQHLDWQMQQVAQGDYGQRVEFMGDFSRAFNGMIEQLNQRSAALIEAKREAETASRAKTEFLAMISHEIRTPLNAILGLSDIQLQNELPAGTHGDLEKIYLSGSNLLTIINDMLDISKIEAGGFELLHEEYDTPSMIVDTVQLNLVRIGSKPITFELDIEESFPSKLYGDEVRVRQILSNLLSNAFKYTKQGTVTLQVRWAPTDDGPWLVFTVSDTGIGIRHEDLEKLFSEYLQLDMQANRKIEGTGLGLSITKKLLEMMGGTISVQSEYGKGSAFTVRFRQGVVDSLSIGKEAVGLMKKLRPAGERPRNKSSAKNLVRVQMPYGKVLVVDDVLTNLDVAKRLLMPYGLIVDCVTSGWDAIECIRRERVRYDVVFMDHMMPGLDGIETARVIREEIGTEYAKSIPIIALTANARYGNEGLFLAHGFNGFISKPINLQRLDAVLNQWIRDKYSQRAQDLVEATVYDDDAGLDMQAGVQHYGSIEAYREILRSYAAHTPALLETMRGVSQATLPDYAVAVHGLKGASQGIGANAVGRMAELLEEGAKKGDYAFVAARHEAFARAVEGLLAALPDLLRDTEEDSLSESRETKDAPDRERLADMLAACRRFNLPEMKKNLAELEKFDYASEPDLVPWLRNCTDCLEYKAIKERLEAFLA